MKLLGRVIFATTVLFWLSTLTWAEPDPPGRVARLQYVQGSVSVQPRGTEDWVAATVNRPLTTSDNMWVDKDSRAELNVGTGVLRMNSETSVTLTNVSDSTVQVQLNQGTLNLRVRRLYRGQIYEVDTPNMAFTVQKSGQYRFDVGASGDATLVTVWQGEGDATGNGPAVRVRAHQRVRFTGGTSLAHEIYEAPPFDGFDDWCRVRDRREDHAVSTRYVSPGVIGYEDLDDYGDWRVLPTYGPVWVPVVVAPGWAPYHYGRWVWVSPWGWTWVDDAPWGFAPFHYGRWIYTTGYWAWVPGPVYVRPVYAPALVAWFGGSNFSIGISFGGGYGWCPLGYGEPFIPWYGSSRNYFQRVNITNTRITNITYITNNYYDRDRDRDRDRDHRKPAKDFDYANLKAPGAVTAVPHHAIENSLPVAKAAIPVSPREASELRSAWLRGNVDLAPTRESRLGDGAGRTTSAPPEKIFTRPVVTKLTPPVTPQLQPKDASADKQPDRAVPTRIADKENPVMRPDRVIPRPPQQPREVNVDVARPAAAPRPPAADNSEVRSAQPGLARVVPRPPDRNGVESAKPAASGADGSQPGNRPHVYTTLPAVRAVPRTPDSPGSENRAAAGPSVSVRPNDDDSRPASLGNNNVPRPSGPVSLPKGIGPDEHPARITPESELLRSNNNNDVPRPSGPVAPPKGVGPDEHPAPIAPSSAPQGNYGESPRFYGGSPSSMADPVGPSATPPPATAPSATRTAPQPAPAPRDNSAAPNRGAPASSNAATPNTPRDR